MSLLVSFVIVATTFMVSHNLKRLFCRSADRSKPSLGLSLILDFVTSVEFIVATFELGIVLEHYGLAVWCPCLFVCIAYQVTHWKDFSFPTPSDRLVELISGKVGVVEAALRTATLLLTGKKDANSCRCINDDESFSGLFSFRLVGLLWALEMSSHHSGRYDSLTTATCAFPFKDVSTASAMAAETIGSFSLGVGIPLIAENPTLSNNEPLITVAVISGFILTTILCALHISGGMFNPMLATVLFGGCEGHSMAEHVAVYWGGGMLGAAAAHLLYPTIRKAVYPALVAQETKKSA
jgi:hypothetical protein